MCVYCRNSAVGCWSRCQAMSHWATPHLTLSPALHFQPHPVHSCSPPGSSIPSPLWSYGYRTRSSVCSSCCDQRASRFHRRFISQPAQRGGGGYTFCGSGGKVVYLPHKITRHHWRCHIARSRLVLKQWHGPLWTGLVRVKDSFKVLVPGMLVGLTQKTKEYMCEC